MIHRLLITLCALCLVTPLWAAPATSQTLYSFVRPTDAVLLTTQDVSLPQSRAEQTVDGEVLRRVVFNPVAQPSLRLAPPTGVWDWSADSAMTLRLQSGMDWALTVLVKIESRDGKVLTSRIDVPAGPAQTILVPLKAWSSESLGMRAGPPMPWVNDGQRLLITNSVGELDPSQVVGVTLTIPQPNVAQSLLLERMGVQQGDALQTAAYTGIVDGYGQFSRGKWPEKISSDDQLKSAAEKEQQQLKVWQGQDDALVHRDTFGGMKDGQYFDATGFFRTEKRDGRWYLVTPDGHPFYSLGVNTVTATDTQTYVSGREYMFSDLPKPGDPLAVHYGQGDDRTGNGATLGRNFDNGRWYDFYGANLQRTYGSKCADLPADIAAAPATGAAASSCQPITFDTARWQHHSIDRLLAWGFNTLGNWSDPALSTPGRMPYTMPLLIHGDFASISTGLDLWGGMPDPFDPRFAMATERAVAIATRDHSDDPWLLGYFADNELAWSGSGTDVRSRYALAYSTLRLSTDVPAKRAFLKMLRDKYRNQEGLSKAWGINLPEWEQLEDPGFEAPLPSTQFPQIEEDFKHFQRLFADTYFKTISDSLKWHAPNQLLLGGRFASSNREAVESCAQYCDVISFNFYTRQPQDGFAFAFLRQLDKPVLVSEFNFSSTDRGPFWASAGQVAKEDDRGPAYANFVKQALSEPSIVGVHWFQYLDEPVSGRLLDGENGHLGLVGITDVPFQSFVEAVRKANLQAADTFLKTIAPKPDESAKPASASGKGAHGAAGKAGEGQGKGHGGVR